MIRLAAALLAVAFATLAWAEAVTGRGYSLTDHALFHLHQLEGRLHDRT